MNDYYQARASEYETVYAKPERQGDLVRLGAWLAAEVRGGTVLEVACGTGYWTRLAAATARSILATDINAGPLAIARAKALPRNVSFVEADAFALPDVGRCFDTGMAHFWWSHLALEQRAPFLAHWGSRLGARAKLLMIDNRFVPGSSTPIARRDAAGNTYQLRRLRSGATYEVLKNFTTASELSSALAPAFPDVEVLELEYYWAVRARRDG
jgi:demethylmenaquinone methyltransferase/2-methoxy-6-polyprenyl-1,4-benzoquinol methylase